MLSRLFLENSGMWMKSIPQYNPTDQYKSRHSIYWLYDSISIEKLFEENTDIQFIFNEAPVKTTYSI